MTIILHIYMYVYAGYTQLHMQHTDTSSLVEFVSHQFVQKHACEFKFLC